MLDLFTSSGSSATSNFSPDNILIDIDSAFIGLCLEWFLYGLYSGIFAVYLKYTSNKSRKTTIIFYTLCLLYVLSTVTVLSDFAQIFISIQNTNGLQYSTSLGIFQTVASGLCDFVAQCIMIYRCWIVWDRNIRFVIIPSFLAIAYIATWLASDFYLTDTLEYYQSYVKWFESTVGFYETSTPGRPPLDPMIITSFVLSMAVNTLMTGLIVLKIFKVSMPTTTSTGGTNLRHIIFIIIESGMALFAIQMVRVVISCLPMGTYTVAAFNIMTGINEMFNGIAPTIILVRVSMRSSTNDNESFKEVVESLCFNNPPSDPNIFQRESVGSCSMQLQEIQSPEETRKSEDICFDNSPSNPNILPQMESSSSMPSQDRIEDTTV